MSRLAAAFVACLAVILAAAPARAAGTPAGTVITNEAAVSYQLNGAQVERHSNPAYLTIDKKRDLMLTWEDTTCVAGEPGEPQAMLTYRLTNTGNSGEAFTLIVTNTLPGDQFDPLRSSLYLDSNGNGSFDAQDRPYDPATPPSLSADAALFIFVFNGIPAPLAGGASGSSRLTATAATGSGSPGTSFPPQTPGGTGAVVGPSGAQVSAEGCYQAGEMPVALVKSATVSDPHGGSAPMAGATITYRIDVRVDGPDPARDLVVSDAVPDHTAYLPGSLRLATGAGTQPLTDAVDNDRGQVIETPQGSGQSVIEFPLGTLIPGNYVVTFQVTIL